VEDLNTGLPFVHRRIVNRRFGRWPLGRRLIALAAAYAIVLSSLIVSFDVARAAVPTPGTITCHSDAGGTAPPAGSQPDGKLCDASCCIGCLMLTAALPPPPAKGAEASRLSGGRPLLLAAVVTFVPVAHTASHQSRAPPRAA
jgi:hypothetical protein